MASISENRAAQFLVHGPSATHDEPVESSWTRLSRVIRGVDERKIRDCKEDIDTILVFAGLFSAVMTAFLVESYQTLQQDPMATIVSLLQQIALNDSGVDVRNAQMAGSSSPQPSFNPTLNAQRVNVLWFISLVLSLVSASFGIIVKQWLREYMAGEYTSAQALLRIRHFRHPGLSQYKVFEIAAILPLLLQLSLALFLVGLCFFTADVHSSIGHTTVPLVAAWGFLFLAITSIPIWDPVCPYKTPFLTTLINVLRRHLSQHSIYDEHSAKYTDKSDIDILLDIDSTQADDQLLKGVLWEALQQTCPQPEDIARFLLKVIGHRVQGDILLLLRDGFLDLNVLPRDTCIIIMDMVADLVLLEVERLSPSASRNIFESAQQEQTWNDWLEYSVCVLLSSAEVPHSRKCNEVLHACLSDGRHHTIAHFIHRRIDIRGREMPAFYSVMRRLGGALALIGDPKLLGTIIDDLFHYQAPPVLIPRMPGAPDSQAEYEIEVPVRRLPEWAPFVLEFLIPWLRRVEETGRWTLTDRILLCELFKVSGRTLAFVRAQVIKLVKTLLLSERTQNGEIISQIALSNGKIWSEVRITAQEVFIEAVMAADTFDRFELLCQFNKRLQLELENLASQQLTSIPQGETKLDFSLDPLDCCWFHLRLMQRILNSGGEVETKHEWQWKTIFASLVNHMNLYAAVVGEPLESEKIAIRCLELMDEIEPRLPSQSTQHSQSILHDSFNSSLLQWSPFTDSFIQTLMRFVRQSRQDWRVQRIRRAQHTRLPPLPAHPVGTPWPIVALGTPFNTPWQGTVPIPDQDPAPTDIPRSGSVAAQSDGESPPTPPTSFSPPFESRPSSNANHGTISEVGSPGHQEVIAMQAHSDNVIPTNYTPFDTEVQQQSESVHHDNDIYKPSMAVPNVLDGMVRDRVDQRPFSRLSDAVIPEPVYDSEHDRDHYYPPPPPLPPPSSLPNVHDLPSVGNGASYPYSPFAAQQVYEPRPLMANSSFQPLLQQTYRYPQPSSQFPDGVWWSFPQFQETVTTFSPTFPDWSTYATDGTQPPRTMPWPQMFMQYHEPEPVIPTGDTQSAPPVQTIDLPSGMDTRYIHSPWRYPASPSAVENTSAFPAAQVTPEYHNERGTGNVSPRESHSDLHTPEIGRDVRPLRSAMKKVSFAETDDGAPTIPPPQAAKPIPEEGEGLVDSTWSQEPDPIAGLGVHDGDEEEQTIDEGRAEGRDGRQTRQSSDALTYMEEEEWRALHSTHW